MTRDEAQTAAEFRCLVQRIGAATFMIEIEKVSGAELKIPVKPQTGRLTHPTLFYRMPDKLRDGEENPQWAGDVALVLWSGEREPVEELLSDLELVHE